MRRSWFLERNNIFTKKFDYFLKTELLEIYKQIKQKFILNSLRTS